MANLSHQWLRSKLLAIEAALALWGFVVISEGKDGATENRSETKNRSTLSLRDLCTNRFMKKQGPETTNQANDALAIENSKRYSEHELPWDLPVAHQHPSMPDVIVVQCGDAPHAIKKMRNAMELSGKCHSDRDLHLNGLPIQLHMAQDIWERCPDADSAKSSQICFILNCHEKCLS